MKEKIKPFCPTSIRKRFVNVPEKSSDPKAFLTALENKPNKSLTDKILLAQLKVK